MRLSFFDSESASSSTWSTVTAVGAGLGASACCTIPLALVSLGVGGTWIDSLTALAAYRWFFVAGAVGALAYAGYNEWRLSRRPDCNCETVFSSAARRSLLGAGALVVLVLIISPWLIEPSPSAVPEQKQRAATKSPSTARPSDAAARESSPPASLEQVVLTVDGMTCKACPITVRKALKQVDGVSSAKTSFQPPKAVVRFDPAKVSVDDLTQATANVGYPSKLNAPS